MFFDPIYLLFIAPGTALRLWAATASGAPLRLTRKCLVREVTQCGSSAALCWIGRGLPTFVCAYKRLLSDHYNPLTKELGAIRGGLQRRSIAAIGVAAHAAGHAIHMPTLFSPLGAVGLGAYASVGSSLGYLVMV